VACEKPVAKTAWCVLFCGGKGTLGNLNKEGALGLENFMLRMLALALMMSSEKTKDV
jgi:hypothetical protein